MADVAQLARRLERLKSLRLPHEKVWRDCFDHAFPIRGSGLQQSNPLTAQQAMDRKARLLHSVATDAGRTLAAAIVSGAVPSSSVWGLLDVPMDDDAGKRWLDEAAKTLHGEIHASNFDACAMEAALDLVAAGWFALYIDVDRNEGGFDFDLWPIAGVYCAASKPGGLIDTVLREYVLTAEQAVTEFGATRVSGGTLKKAQTSPDAEVRICHAIYPRTPSMVGARLAKNLPIASCHFEIDAKHELRESGYHEMPVIVPRWSLIPASVYAVGPMFDALPDARTLNEIIGMDMMNLDLNVSGMWIAEDDGVLNARSVKVGPRKVIVANSVDSMKQLSAGGQWQLTDSRIAQYAAAIRKVLMADQLQPVDGPQMTATEVHVRVGMIRQLLGPIYGRLQAEWLAPMMTRCFGLAFRAGILGEPPQSIVNRNYHVRYNNPLARAQKLEDVGAVERLLADATSLASLGEVAPSAPAALDVIDFDETMRVLVEGLGVPLKATREADDVAALREQRAEQQKQAEQQAMAQQVGMMATQTAMDRSAKAA